ncbi:MAG TPA: hypothetical protein VMU05_18000 [Dongiaceae bacterium]|nr:hypothetical protein [Dongiaceae bacterium]
MSIYVVFFGGYKATQTDMELWLANARKQRDDVTFEAYSYPVGATWERASAVNAFSKQFDEVIKKIEDSGADTIYIVGHSSGCAIADELNSRLKGDHSHITLVVLDGFTPLAPQVKKSSVQVWSAEEVGGTGKSLNWARGHKMYPAINASNPWSLHYSLVNKAASDAIKGIADAGIGYAGCLTNLEWLERREPWTHLSANDVRCMR